MISATTIYVVILMQFEMKEESQSAGNVNQNFTELEPI